MTRFEKALFWFILLLIILLFISEKYRNGESLPNSSVGILGDEYTGEASAVYRVPLTENGYKIVLEPDQSLVDVRAENNYLFVWSRKRAPFSNPALYFLTRELGFSEKRDVGVVVEEH